MEAEPRLQVPGRVYSMLFQLRVFQMINNTEIPCIKVEADRSDKKKTDENLLSKHYKEDDFYSISFQFIIGF